MLPWLVQFSSITHRKSRFGSLLQKFRSASFGTSQKPWEREFEVQKGLNKFLMRAEDTIREKIRRKEADQSSLLEFWKQYVFSEF